MVSPVNVEKDFQKLNQDLDRVQSIRHRIWLICRFIESLEGEFNKYESYLLQVLSRLPRFAEPLTYSGLDPAWMESCCRLLDRAVAAVTESEKITEFSRNRARLRQVTILQFSLVNDLESVSGSIMQEMKYRKKFRNEKLPEFDADSFHAENAKKLFTDLTNKASLAGGDFHLFLKEIEEQYNCFLNYKSDSCLVPAVEEYDSNQYGRLRLMSIDIRGKSNEEKDRFYRSFETAGVENSRWEISENVIQSARTLAEYRKPGIKESFFEGEIKFHLSNAIHAGSSSDAACSVLMALALKKYVSDREWMEFEQHVAITGEVTGDGQLKEISKEGISNKTEAAFFSWANVLVVPMKQVAVFNKELAKLEKLYPNRRLTIIGLKELKEIFYDRRITNQVKISKTRFYGKKVWERKFAVLSYLMVLVLLGVIVRLVTGPLDKNVVMAEFRGTNMKLMNQLGFVVKSVSMEPGFISYLIETSVRAPRVDFYDITGDGINEVFWTEGVPALGHRNGVIKAWSVTGDSLIWETDMTFNPEFPQQHGLESMHFQVDQFYFTKNRSDELKLIASCDSGVNFPSVIAILDAGSGEVEGHYLHTGKLRDIKLIDINDDGTDEIIAVGINNAFWQASIAVLDIERINGHSPTKGDHMPVGIPRAEEIAYILIPKTIAGRVFDSVDKYSEARRIRNREVYSQFIVDIRDLPSREFRDRDYIPYMLFYFNYDLSLESIVTSDLYDIFIHELHRDGHLPFVPGYDYFEAFRDSLVWVE